LEKKLPLIRKIKNIHVLKLLSPGSHSTRGPPVSKSPIWLINKISRFTQ